MNFAASLEVEPENVVAICMEGGRKIELDGVEHIFVYYPEVCPECEETMNETASVDNDDDVLSHPAEQKDRHGKSWIAGEDATLIALKESGRSSLYIAEDLGRTIAAVETRACYLRKKGRLSGR